MVNDDTSQIIECQLRLHSARPTGKGADELVWADWEATAVGGSETFQAVANPGNGSWNGPLPPGVTISPPVALDDPW